MITEIEDFFLKGCGRCERFATADCSTRQWSKGLTALRELCLGAGLTETVKWGHPCYMHAGRNIAIIGAFRDDFRLNFMDAALLKDPDAVLQKQGDNSQHASMIQFKANGDVDALAAVVKAYLAEAMSYAAAGQKALKTQAAIELPDEMVNALDADPALAEAFHRLTPGRQRSYALNLNAAKKPDTRLARIAKFREGILAGKGANEL